MAQRPSSGGSYGGKGGGKGRPSGSSGQGGAGRSGGGYPRGGRPSSGGSSSSRSGGGYPRGGDQAPRREDRGGYTDNAQRSGERAPRKSFDDRPPRSYDDRGPRRDDRGGYGDRPQRSYDDRGPRRDDRGGSGGYGDRPQRSYGDRPQGDRPQRSYGDRPQGDRPQRSYGDRGPRRDDRGGSGDRGGYRGGPRRDDRTARPRVEGPAIPDEVTGSELDMSIRGDLRGLSLEAATIVSRHLVMTQRLLEDRPDLAWQHAKAAVARGGRLAVVREAAGVAAYTAGEYADALAQFRAARRISGSDDYWPIMADCERGLGRPERAISMAGAPEVDRLDRGGRVEMRIVASGARRDLGQLDAAVVTLQCAELQSSSTEPWSARLKFAYADALLAAGREDEAREWFARAVDVDVHDETDAAERLADLEGLVWVDALDEDAVDAEDDDDRSEAGTYEDDLEDDVDDDASDDVLDLGHEPLESELDVVADRLEVIGEELLDLVDPQDADGPADVDPEDEVAELLGEGDDRTT